MGEAAQERLERLVAEATSGMTNLTTDQIEAFRKHAEDFITPKPEVLDRISEKFIIDKSKYTVTFDEIMKMASAAA